MKIKWTEKKLALAGFIGLFAAPVLHEREHGEQGVQVPLRED